MYIMYHNSLQSIWALKTMFHEIIIQLYLLFLLEYKNFFYFPSTICLYNLFILF